MKKIIFIISFILSIILFTISIVFCFKSSTFSHNNVLKNIQYLSSDNFKGRLPGTLENEEAAQFISSQFRKYGLIPLCPDYKQAFKTKYPAKIAGNPYLEICDTKGNIVKEYTYDKDYKEDMLNFRKNAVSFKKSDSYILKHSIQVRMENDNFIFYVPSTNGLSFRSSFSKDAEGAMYIMLTEDTFTDIKNYLDKDFQVKCFIPYTVKETTIYNVAGIIKGKNPKLPPLIISAHFDHVGTDLAGNIYNGALDNASGVSFMLELCRYIKSLGKPESSIIFVAFNAEEYGFKGSEAFENSYYNMIKNGKVFNFDMIGCEGSIPLCIMGSSTDTSNTPLMRVIGDNCSSHNIYFRYLFQDASDHEPFRANNIDAVTFCDDDTSSIHTPSDKAGKINSSGIDRCYKAVMPEIFLNAYNNDVLLIYHRENLVISFLGMLLFPFLIIQYPGNKHSSL